MTDKIFNKEDLYKVAKLIAESDSIGESYKYCLTYDRGRFAKDLKTVKEQKPYPFYDQEYVSCAKEIFKALNLKLVLEE